MSVPTLLLDAHNIIHQHPALRGLLGSIEKARGEFERMVAGCRSCLIFYDGGPGGRREVVHRLGKRIEYAGAGEADACILDWLKDHPGKRAVVVTDDRALRAQARALGARLMTAAAFLATCKPGPGSESAATEAAPSRAEIEMWLKLFGDMP